MDEEAVMQMLWNICFLRICLGARCGELDLVVKDEQTIAH